MGKAGDPDPHATSCNAMPEPMKFSLSRPDSKSFLSTSIEPFPIGACTSRGKSNPMTIQWQKT
jgi:hypothetical protein